MARFLAFSRGEWLAIFLVFVSFSIQLLLVTRPLDFLVLYLLPDDAFYYFEIARAVALGHGSTFDGVNATNGYHPLWLLVLIPLFSYFSVGGALDVAPIHAALVFSVLLSAATAFIVARILTRFTENASIRLFGLFVWLFNPFLLYEMINGLETSLSLFLFALFFLLVLRVEERQSANYIVPAIVGGLMVLARLDLAFYVAAFLVWIVVRREWREGLRSALAAAFVAALVVVPWFAWNGMHFGTVITSSSVASTIVNHGLIAQDHGESWFQTGKAVVYSMQYELDKLFERTGMYALACAFFGAGALLVVFGFLKAPRRLALLTAVQALALGLVLLFVANAGVRWTVRSWYFVSFNLFLAVFVVHVLDHALRRASLDFWKRVAGAFLLGAVAFSFAVNWSKVQRRGMPQQEEMYKASLWMNENLPEGSVIGVFNAGIQGYVSDHTVINLDGLVNNAALAALKERALWAYVEESDIGYIADFPLYLSYRYKSFLGVENVFDGLELLRAPDTAGGLSIWRVK